MWEQAWLGYREIPNSTLKDYILKVSVSKAFKKDQRVNAALEEIQHACQEMFGEQMKVLEEGFAGPGLVIEQGKEAALTDEGYRLFEDMGQLKLVAQTGRGILYGVFAVIEAARLGKSIDGAKVESIPDNGFRMLNHWDNMDGSVERGYAGASFFFKENQILDTKRLKDYARLMASIGINGVVINNVNVKDEATYLITHKHFERLAEISQLFYTYGIQLYLSINYAAPMEIGGLDTADPFDEGVIAWWSEQSRQVFENIPYFGGYLVKADSEGRKGPFSYGRNQADGANMLAKAVAPFGGIIIWRCFVYNCQQDWRDLKTDRAKAGFEAFMPLDGVFDENVILQIKNGPMDFQVREPVSPLFGAMEKTNQMLEVQAAQEYTGQQRHVCYLIPMWKEVLEFDTRYHNRWGRVKDVISGKTYERRLGGMSAVSNMGDDPNWTGHDLAGANLYGFGKLAWNTDLDAQSIAYDWSVLTFGENEALTADIVTILMNSWLAYEGYTSPLGIGWMVNVSHHYGPSPDGYEYDRWGTYHRADLHAIGVDRTMAGTGYTGQYHPENSALYENIETCPNELLLFFHRIPYTYQLSTGKTLIQHIYDSHFEGAQEATQMCQRWKQNEALLSPHVFGRTLLRFEHQVEHAQLWRDVINSYFYRKCGIDDEKQREIYE